MNAPIPNKRTFPKSWKKWRMLKHKEPFRFTDRVVTGGWDGFPKSIQLGKNIISGDIVNPSNSPLFPEGWYYRKVE